MTTEYQPNPKVERMFSVTIETAATLTVSELWPDGDAPANPTTDDVHTLIQEMGGAVEVVTMWGLEPLQVYVSGPELDIPTPTGTDDE